MNQAMTIHQINSSFVSEWVLIEDPQTDEFLRVISGKVILHNRDRDEFDRLALSFHPQRFAVIYTGSISENTAVIL